LEVVFKYYEVGTFQIWDYEKYLFLDGVSSEEHMWKVMEGIHHILIRNVQPSFTQKDYEQRDQKFKDKYDRDDKRYAEAFSNLKEVCRLNYFMIGDNMYEYSREVIIDPSHEDFDFWFALKLRQYKDKILEIDNFLDHQLKESFDLRFVKFKRFLILNIRQYRKEFFAEQIVETVEEWVQHYQENPDHIVNTENKELEATEKESNDLEAKVDPVKKSDLASLNTSAIPEKNKELEATEKESNDLEAKVDPVKKSDLASLNTSAIPEKTQNDLLMALKPFFTPKDHADLANLIRGEFPKHKLLVKGNGNQFVEVFRQIRLNNILTEHFTKIRDWICHYFTYNKSTVGVTKFDPEYVYKVLTAKKSKLPKHNRIQIGGRDFIIDKSKISQKKS